MSLATEGEIIETLGPEETTTTSSSTITSTTKRPTNTAQHPCILEEGMNNTQYLLEPEINGAHKPSSPNIKPGGQGVTFLTDNGYIAITIAPGVTPIVEYISIANTTITNVIQVTVAIVGQSSNAILNSPAGSTVVTGFPTTPLPENTTFIIAFKTATRQYPANVTLSIVACFHLALTTFASTSKLKYNYRTYYFHHCLTFL